MQRPPQGLHGHTMAAMDDKEHTMKDVVQAGSRSAEQVTAPRQPTTSVHTSLFRIGADVSGQGLQATHHSAKEEDQHKDFHVLGDEGCRWRDESYTVVREADDGRSCSVQDNWYVHAGADGGILARDWVSS